MSTTPFDSDLYRDLFHDAETGRLFTDSAEVRAMLIVEGTLAKVQGAAGVIPELSAAAIHRASLELQIDPGGLSSGVGQSAVPVPALIEAFRVQMNAPEHAQFVHWGATSQDIMDTGLVLRLRQVIGLQQRYMVGLIHSLADLSEKHADLPVAGRTWGQIATPTSFGAIVSCWGQAQIGWHDRLREVSADLLVVSLSGAAGTGSELGDVETLRPALAEALGLGDPGRSWHSDRSAVMAFGSWITGTLGSLAKMGEDLLTMSADGEVVLGASGGSSTMPQKRNPLGPSLLATLHGLALGLNATLQSAAAHRQQRDAAAWMREWLVLGQMCMALSRALVAARDIATGLRPDAAAMSAAIARSDGAIFAEALSFRLAREMPRPEAQTAVKTLCQQSAEAGVPLQELARESWPDLDLADTFDATARMGTAPAEARDFARSARKLTTPDT